MSSEVVANLKLLEGDAEELRALNILENVRRRVIDITRDEVQRHFDTQVGMLVGKEEMSMAAAAAAARKTCNQLYGGNNGEGDAFAMMKYLLGSGRCVCCHVRQINCRLQVLAPIRNNGVCKTFP